MPSAICLLVLGMHRSGTSAFAGVLHLLGANLGTDLMKPADANEKGYFENYRVYEANERILAHLGSSWDDPLPLPEEWWKDASVAPFKDELKEIVSNELNHEFTTIKDPRLCRLLPLWKEILEDLGIDYRFVIPLRDPLEVAESLKKRNGFSREKSALLWVMHVLSAELYSRNRPRVFLTFDELLARPSHTVLHLFETLELNLPILRQDTISSIEEFLKPTLKHHHHSSTDNKQLIYYVFQLYQLFLELAAKKASTSTT